MKKIKSEKGFTMEDLTVAVIIIITFVGIITSLMYSVKKLNIETDLTAQMTSYAVQIIEDIDKISYEEVNEELAKTYNKKFSISKALKIDFIFSKYFEWMENMKDLIKIVDLKISYTFKGNEQKFTVQKLKIKEM